MIVFWTNAAAIAAHTAYAIPAEAGLPANAYLIGVRSLSVAPLASAGAASTTSPLTETGTANNTADPAAGLVSVQTATQQLVSGDAIPADAIVFANVIIAGEANLNP